MRLLTLDEITLVSGGEDSVEVEAITVTAERSGFSYYAQHDGSMQNPPLVYAGTRPALDERLDTLMSAIQDSIQDRIDLWNTWTDEKKLALANALDATFDHAPYTDLDGDGDTDMADGVLYHRNKASENANMFTEDGRGHTAEALYLDRVSKWVDYQQSRVGSW